MFYTLLAFRRLAWLRPGLPALVSAMAASVALAMPVRAATADAESPSHSTNDAVARDLKKFQLGPGLRLEAVATEPLVLNPVAFSIDGQGRFYIAETHRYGPAVFDITANTPWLLDDLSARTVGDRAAFLARTFATNFAVLTNTAEVIRRVDDRDGDGRAETSTILAEGFRDAVTGPAAGILVQGTNLWFACIPDLWRFSMTEAGTAEGGRRLATGLGVHISVSGHDVHGLIRGPDGRIYFSFGDRGIAVTKEPGVEILAPDTGGVLRCEPDGQNLELFCVGLRNPQELAFDDLGNLWTVDNDTAGADPCRVLHLVEGADYGWRTSYQHMKGFGPWVQEELWRGGLDGQPAPAGTVSQGPAGLAFYPGTSRTPQLAGKFLHADFPGGIWAFDVKPRGASYGLGAKEKVLWNCWPTDVEFGPDGGLYVLDWVQGWTAPAKGRIYRLTSAGSESNAVATAELMEVQRLLRDGMARRPEQELADLLGHRDRRVRLEAQWELAGRGTPSLALFAGVARTGSALFSRLHALWGFRMVLRTMAMTDGVEELASLLPLLQDRDPEIRGQAALALGEGHLLNAEVPMSALLSDASPRTRFLAVQGYTARFRDRFGASGISARPRTYFSSGQKVAGAITQKIASAVGADPVSAAAKVGAAVTGRFPARELNRMLPANSDEPFVLQAVVDFLAHTRRNNAFESHFALEPSGPSALALLWANRRARQPAIAGFLTNADPRLLLETARAINDAPIPEAYPALAQLLDDPRFRDPAWGRAALSNLSPAGPFSALARPPGEQILRRALNARFHLGGITNAQALVRFALGPVAGDSRNPAAGTPARLRSEALFLLGAWEVLPGRVGNLPIKPTKDPNHGSVPSVNPENWPGWFDRVVGLWRPLAPRPADDARAALTPAVASLIADPDDDVALAAVEASTRLALSQAAPVLLARLRSPTTAVSIRQRVPGALAALQSRELRDAIPLALADSNSVVRAAALPYLQQLEGETALSVLGPILHTILQATNGPSAPKGPAPDLRLAQAALHAMGELRSPGATAVLVELAQAWQRGALPPALELELLEASAGRTAPELRALASGRLAPAAPGGDALSAWHPTLVGGDAGRGRTVFLEKVEVQCVRCHQVAKEGGTVGPALDGVGGRLSRESLLDSILHPNQVIAPGFESVLLTMRNGAEHAGVVKGETTTELRVESAEEGLLTLAKADVVERRKSLSAMPEGLGEILTRRELRDLIEFLAGLK